MENELNDISPYVDAFSFFLDHKPIKAKYKSIFQTIIDDKNIINDYLPNYISEIVNNYILIQNSDTEEMKLQKLIFQKSPQKTFDFLLNELHKIFLGKEIFKSKIKSIQTSKENAFNFFKNFMDQDKSYISENFYGLKVIEKKCPECRKTQYIYNYVKTIPIRIEDLKEEKIINFEKCIKKIQSKFKMIDVCSFCEENRNLEIKIKIEKYPKIMIFVIYGSEKNIQFKIKNSIKHGEYELIGAEIKTKNNLLFNLFCIKNNNYKFIYNEPIDEEIFNNSIPIVLFYKKRGQMLFEIETGENSKDSFCSSNQTTDNYEVIQKEDILINNKIKKQNNLNKSKNTEKINSNDQGEITLIFKIKKSENEFSIKTNYFETFDKIINELKNKSGINDIDSDKIFFNNRKIKMDKTPRDYNITNESHIIVGE